MKENYHLEKIWHERRGKETSEKKKNPRVFSLFFADNQQVENQQSFTTQNLKGDIRSFGGQICFVYLVSTESH